MHAETHSQRTDTQTVITTSEPNLLEHFHIGHCFPPTDQHKLTSKDDYRWGHVKSAKHPQNGAGLDRRSHGGLVEGLDSLSAGGLCEADAVAAGDDDVCVVHESVNERGGDGSGHEFLEA